MPSINNAKPHDKNTNPWVKFDNGTRYRLSLIGGVKVIRNCLYLSGLDGGLLTRVETDSDDDALILLEEINAQIDAFG